MRRDTHKDSEKNIHFLLTKILELPCLPLLPGYNLDQRAQSNGCVWRKCHSFSAEKSCDSLQESGR